MGEVVQVEFGKKLAPLRDMPKSAPEVLNQLAVFAHDRNDIIKHLTEAERKLHAAEILVKDWRMTLAGIDGKIAEAQKGLVEDIVREVIRVEPDTVFV